MAAVFKSLDIFGPASVLLLLAALLAAGARADRVTTAECAARGRWQRVRQYPVDSDAHLLVMSSCNLTGIQPHHLSGLPALTSLLLYSNELRELPVFDEHACANLTRLDLYDNQLTEINSGTFSACTKLEYLNLAYNQIDFIHHSVFTALTNLRHLELHFNKIRYIPDQMFLSNGKLLVLYLDHNRLTRLPPDFATSLKRASAGLERFHFHGNPWHCACLVELLADVKSAGVPYYYVEFYDGTRPVCVFTGAVPCRPQTGLLRPARGGR